MVYVVVESEALHAKLPISLLSLFIYFLAGLLFSFENQMAFLNELRVLGQGASGLW